MNMQVFVRTPTGKVITLQVEGSTTVKDVKAKIQDKEAISADIQRLLFVGKVLEDSSTLGEYDVRHDSNLDLHPMVLGVPVDPIVRIVVKKLSGRTVSTFEMVATDTIENLKSKIQNQVGLQSPSGPLKLSFKGKKLEEGHILSEYGIQDEDEVILHWHGCMQITVRVFGGIHDLTLDVKSSDLVESVKGMIQEKEGIPPYEQTLTFLGKEITDSHALNYYYIQDQDEICLGQPRQSHSQSALLSQYMKVIIMIATEKTINVVAKGSDTVANLKAKVYEREGFPTSQQKLTFAGEELQNGYMLSTYSIQAGSIISLELKPANGGMVATSNPSDANDHLETREQECRNEDQETEQQIGVGSAAESEADTGTDSETEGVLAMFQQRNEDLEEEVAQLKQDKCVLKQELQKEIDQLHNDLERERLSYTQAIKDLEKETVTLQQNNARQKRTVTGLQQDKARLEREVAALLQDKARLERQMTTLEREKTRLKRQTTALQQDNTRLESQTTTLWQDKARLERQMITLHQEKTQHQQSVDRLRREMERKDTEYTEGNKAREIQIGSLMEQMSRQLQEMDALQERATEAETRIRTTEELDRQLAAAQERLYSQQQHMGLLEERARLAEQRAQEAEAAVGTPQVLRSYPIDEQEPWLLRKEDLEFTDQELGRGGWGTVQVATLRVAAKCLHGIIVSDYNREMFAREMRVAAKVRHPNLVLFLGATLGREPIILMEKMSTSLRSVLERTPLNPVQITSISLDVARGLGYLHKMQPDPIIHRDVSSANVLLNPGRNRSYRTWVAKLSDYGSANIVKRITTANPGSPAYAAPEAGDPYRQSPKMDVYSYGVLLLEICTRRFPDPDTRDSLVPTVTHPQAAVLIPQCLQHMPQDRPTMVSIAGQF